MCVNRNLEDMEEEAAIDRSLLALLGQWKRYVSLYLSDQDIANMDLIESFCTDMRDSLIRLKMEGKLPADAEDLLRRCLPKLQAGSCRPRGYGQEPRYLPRVRHSGSGGPILVQGGLRGPGAGRKARGTAKFI